MRVHLSNKGRKYKEQAYLQMLEQSVLKGTESARYEVLIDAYVPDRRRRDLDNILKPLLDVMEEYGVVPDDEQIDVLTVRRRERGGYVIVNVLEIEPEYSLAS
jgi:crossover junction endodeoxyribonuclease RusA